jgi:hypothetical protein
VCHGKLLMSKELDIPILIHGANLFKDSRLSLIFHDRSRVRH